MPVQSWGHSQYWSGPNTPAAPPQLGASSNGGYVPFQTTITVGSLFGALQVVYERLLQKVRG